MEAVKTRVLTYVKKLNKIYLETILKNPPHQQIYFRVTEIRRVEDFMVGCENKVYTYPYLLVHLLVTLHLAGSDFGRVYKNSTV